MKAQLLTVDEYWKWCCTKKKTEEAEKIGDAIEVNTLEDLVKIAKTENTTNGMLIVTCPEDNQTCKQELGSFDMQIVIYNDYVE